MEINNNPSLNPADNGTLAGTMNFVFSKLMQQTNGMLPAQVIKYDRDANRVQVQLLISMLTTNGEIIARSQLASLPVLVIGGGGYMINFPLNPGDLGWVAANDRDISLFLQSYSQVPPNTTRMFDFADGLFIPDAMKGYTIDPIDDGNMVIQNLAGTVKIALSPTAVTITAPAVVVNGPLAANGGITASGGLTPVNIVGNVMMTGDLRVVGNITASGAITPFVP